MLPIVVLLFLQLPSIRDRSALLEALSDLPAQSRALEASQRAREVESIREERLRAVDALIDHLARMKRALSGPTADYGDSKRYRKLRERFEKVNGIK